jgi:predicted P-loop ATPase
MEKKKKPTPNPSRREESENGGEKKRKEHKKNWRELYASIDDIKQFLLERVILRHNVITQQTEVHLIEQAPKPPDEATARPEDYVRWLKEWQESEARAQQKLRDEDYYQLLTDRIENTLYTELKAQKQVRMQDLHSVIESDFVPEYHPFREYLEHLPPWREGDADHIMGLSLSVNVRGDADEQMLFYEYLKKWLVAMVASWVDPGVVNNVMLVLIGEQGSYKTTWFSYLLPPELRRYFYTKTNANRMTKDDLLTLSQYGLVCCEELDTMRPSELNQLKAAMTMPAIDERAAYARHKEHREHIASFCGTGNNVQFLSDTTGNRRWLPFEVSSIDSPRSSPFDYVGIYSQAYALYRQGFRYWFDADEVRRLARHNEQFETPSLEKELIDQYFRRPEGKEPGEFLPVSMALQIVGANITQKLSTVLLGRAFVEMGYKKQCIKHVRGYVVVRLTADEMKARRHQLAQGGTDGTDGTAVF